MAGNTGKEKLKEQVKEALEDLVDDVVDETTAERKPGQILDNGKSTARKVPWQRSEVEKTYPKVTFTPEENIHVTVHGHIWYLHADETVTVPSIIKDIYDEHRRQNRKNSASYRITPAGDAVHVSLGAGALEPEKFIEKA